MPPVPVIPNAIKVGWKWANGSQTAFMTFGVSTTTTDLASVASQIQAHVTQAMFDAVTSNARIVEQHLFRYDGTTPTFVVATVGGQWDGGQPAAENVVADAVLVSERTAARGQWARGRMYIPFIGEPSIAEGSLLETIRANMQPAWDGFRNAMQSGGTPMAVISLADKPDLNPPHTPAARLVISTTVETLLGTQRRRQHRLRR